MKKGALLLGGCACFLIFALLCFPAEMLAASAEGVQLWLTKVFPSLFPFLVACGILLRIGAAQRMGAALVSPAGYCRLSLLFRTSFRIPHGSKADRAAL